MAGGWHQQILTQVRRARVGELRARGLTALEVLAEINKPLDDGGMRNTSGGEYALSTIENDFVQLDKQWQAAALQSTTEMKGRILAEIEAVKREAWKMGDVKGLTIVIKALARQSLLFGLNAPLQVSQLNWNIDVGALTDEQIKALAAGEDPALVLGQPAQVVEGEVVQSSRGDTGETSRHVLHDIGEKSSDDSDDVSQE